MHLKTRLAVGVTATAAAVGALLIPATNAFAAPAVTATPGSSLFEGAVSQVSGTGLPPNTTVAIAECNLQTAQTVGLDDPEVVFKACDTNTSHIVLNAGPTDDAGNLAATPYTVHASSSPMGTDPSSICDFDTNGQCVLAVGNPSTFELYGFAPITFSEVVATPYLNLHNGDAVAVSGDGLPASTQVVVVECNVANGQDQSACDTSGVGFGETDAAGHLPDVAMTAKTGQVGSNPNGVCNSSSPVGTCVFAVADLATQTPLGFAAFTVAPPVHVATSLSISTSKGKVDKGEKFVIKGRDTANSAGVNGVTVKVQSRSSTSGKWSTVDSMSTKTINGKTGSYKFSGLKETKTKFYRTKSSQKQIGDTIYNADTSGAVKVRFTG